MMSIYGRLEPFISICLSNKFLACTASYVIMTFLFIYFKPNEFNQNIVLLYLTYCTIMNGIRIMLF